MKGTRQTDNSILAARVDGEEEKDEDDDDDEDDDRGAAGASVELKGTIATGSLTGSCASNTLAFKIGTTAVKTNSSTEFKDASCSSLKAGDSVEVRGKRQTDASVLASRVERK